MDISNRSLAFLLVIAIVMSVGGTFVSLNRLANLGPTGLALTDSGDANLTIQTLISVNFDVDTINFGTGYIIGGVGYCDLNTNGTSNSSPNNQCSGFNLSTSPFLINNTGNVDAKLELQSDTNAASFLGGTGVELQWWMDENEAGACTSQNVIFDDWQDINTTIYTVCDTGGFESDFGADTLFLHMRVLIPDDATQIGSERTVTVTGTVS